MDNLLCRCHWCNLSNPLYVDYHDREWGVPLHDDRRLFEMLILEGFQAGLSWECILNKRKAFRKAFDDFDYNRVAEYDETKLEALRTDEGIQRPPGFGSYLNSTRSRAASIELSNTELAGLRRPIK